MKMFCTCNNKVQCRFRNDTIRRWLFFSHSIYQPIQLFWMLSHTHFALALSSRPVSNTVWRLTFALCVCTGTPTPTHPPITYHPHCPRGPAAVAAGRCSLVWSSPARRRPLATALCPGAGCRCCCYGYGGAGGWRPAPLPPPWGCAAACSSAAPRYTRAV